MKPCCADTLVEDLKPSLQELIDEVAPKDRANRKQKVAPIVAPSQVRNVASQSGKAARPRS